MRKVHVVRLTAEEREQLAEIVRKFKGTGQRVRRAQILLKADADGPGWTDQRIADAFGCRRQTVENVRRRLVEDGFETALNGVKRQTPPTPKLLDGQQEAKVIATRLGKPPAGYANWTLRLLARTVVELSIVESISHETVRRTLKKTARPTGRSSTGSSRPRPTPSSSRAWKRCSTPTPSRTTRPARCCAWTSSRCSS